MSCKKDPICITVFKNKDNSSSIQVLLNNSRYSLENVTKVRLVFPGFTISSEDEPTWFDFATFASSGVLIVKLGLSTDIEVDTIYIGNVIICEATAINGLEVGEIRLEVE
jgi:hypothetical protein